MKSMVSEASAIAYATANIVSTNKINAAFTLNIPADVEAALLLENEKKKIKGKIPLDLKKLAKNTLKFFGYDKKYGLEIKVKGEIPPEGLGKREAISIALIFAISGAIAKKHGSINELKIDKYLKEQFLIIDEKVVDKEKLVELCILTNKKLKFERIAASFYGGFVVTDNEKKEILRRGEMEEGLFLVMRKLKKKSKTEENAKFFEHELEQAWNEALKGNLYEAMKLNSLIHSHEETRKMLKKGAITTSFSPPYLIGIFRDKKGDLNIINQGVKILQKPKKIYKTKEFLELERDKMDNISL
jgi:shikimate kinase